MAKKQTTAEQRKQERQNYQKLERRLVLLAWLNAKFGFQKNRELLAALKDTGEGFDEEGRSYVVGRFLSRGEKKCRISAATLEVYDANIRKHLDHINRLRTRPIVLRYFQHLALLYAEIYLDAYFNRRASLLAELNECVDDRNINRLPGDPVDTRFTAAELHKLAYWMATGSGKTLLFHINYLQYLHYARQAGQPIDNILLITPNENLSAQHLDEMAESDIPCGRFSIQESGLTAAHPNMVRVLEITKLVTEKKGSGVSVPVEAFEGHNLIFVDEGHKGTGSDAETWRGRRQALAENGFTFEYSATFGQALDATKKDDVTEEYAKSILFDYSYKYFYGDGYGKDFHILNLKDYEDDESVHTLLLANLLSFYEQRKFYHENIGKIRDYLLEPPLWLQICSRVSATNAEVVTVLQFLARFVVNRQGWAVQRISAILQGESGIETENGADLFHEQLPYLRRGKKQLDAEKTFHEILKLVFQTTMPGALEVLTIKSGKGEVGLRVSGTETYFGLLYIGDVSAFKKIVEVEAPEIDVKEDAISAAIFSTVKEPRSPINLLIGAKKFMEGWSSWRVSNIGLLNVGVGEGSEIIQLFGRGVRLKGLGFNLQRSAVIAGIVHPPHLTVLERLNIFAVRANYMSRFRDYLEREGIDTGGYVEMDLPLWTNKPFLEKKLYTPRIPDDVKFADDCTIVLEFEPSAKVRLDVTTRLTSVQLDPGGGIHESQATAGHQRAIDLPTLSLLDWQRIHIELVNYKQSRGYHNLTIPVGVPRAIMAARDPSSYELSAPDEWIAPKMAQEFRRLQETVTALLRKYVDRFYKHQQQRWESDRMVYDTLKIGEGNFQPYRVSVPRSDPTLVQAIHEIVEEARKVSRKATPKGIYAGDQLELPNVHFDRHLYQPLLIASKSKEIKSSPSGLNEGERIFVEDLRSYCKAELDGALKGSELFLLRNLGRGKGIGFFDSRGFYPDFIIWIKKGSRQRIIFAEPHGMMLEQGGINSEKVNLHHKLRAHSKAALAKGKLKTLDLDACVISVTPYDELAKWELHADGTPYSREEFTKQRILFQERNDEYDYVKHLLEDCAKDETGKA